jgi:hypothetical protein
MLRGMSARLRAGQRLDPHEVERALEAATASAGLKAQIDDLREALTDLRILAVPPGESRVGYGFVLPGQPPQLHAHPN